MKTPGQVLYDALYPGNGDWDLLSDRLKKQFCDAAQKLLDYYRTGKAN